MFLHVPSDAAGQRLDRFLHAWCDGLSRTRIQQLIRDGSVSVNGCPQRASYSIQADDRIEIQIPAPQTVAISAEAIPLDIRFEDESLLVVNKPAGMTVHPAPGSWSGTLVNALLHYCTDLSGINGVLRPGIVHRLDKDTSGLLLVAKSDAAHRGLAAQLEARKITRQYIALVWGQPLAKGTVDAPVGRNPRDRKRMAVVERGRRAVTWYAVRERFGFCALLDVTLETGRTHQIRVHLEHIGYPVFGDPVYGGRNRTGGIRPEYRARATRMLELIDRQALHARALRFVHPLSGAEIYMETELPDDISALIETARP